MSGRERRQAGVRPRRSSRRRARPTRHRATLLPPALSFAKAKSEGKADTIDWGKRCDTELGLLALPLFPQQQCFAPFSGDNGGATTTGVTTDTIKVVVYLAQPNDPVLKFIYSQIQNDDTPDQTFATYQGYNEMFSKYYETYGRKVQLVRFDATGTVSDSVAATADAETIANDIKPFMVLGGPVLTNAFADTLAQNKVMCVSCTPGQPAQWYIDRAPYVWDILANPEQRQQMVAEYIGQARRQRRRHPRRRRVDARQEAGPRADLDQLVGPVEGAARQVHRAVEGQVRRRVRRRPDVQPADGPVRARGATSSPR